MKFKLYAMKIKDVITLKLFGLKIKNIGLFLVFMKMEASMLLSQIKLTKVLLKKNFSH